MRCVSTNYIVVKDLLVLKQIHMKTMPAAMFRLLTGQETPLYI